MIALSPAKTKSIKIICKRIVICSGENIYVLIIISAPFSTIIIVGELVFPDVILGIIDTSITLNF